MSAEAYLQFLALPVGSFFDHANRNGTAPDSFVKVDSRTFRRTYDSITWDAEVEIRGKSIDYQGERITVAEGWDSLKVLVELPEHLGYITEEQAQARREADHKRYVDYVEKYGEQPEMGFW